MPKRRDEVDRMEIAALAVVFLALIFHLLSVIVSERYAEHSGIILFVTLVCGWTMPGLDRLKEVPEFLVNQYPRKWLQSLAKSHCGSYCQPHSIVPNRSE